MEIPRDISTNPKYLLNGLRVFGIDSPDLKILKSSHRLKILRYLFIDELPEELVELDDPKFYFYKCRGNFIQTVMGTFWALLRYQLITDRALKIKIKDFYQFVRSLDFTKKLDKSVIEVVNQIQDDVIAHLGPKILSFNDSENL